MPFVAALSEHPLAAHATGEVVGQVLDALGGPPELAVLLVSGAHGRQFAQIADAVRAALAPEALIGATVVGLLARDREVEEQAAIALWAGSTNEARAVHLEVGPDDGGWTVPGLDPDDGPDVGAGSVLVVLAAPSFPSADAIEDLARRFPALTVVGGVAAAGVRPGDNQLLCDDLVITTGAVGLLVETVVPVSILVSQGCRPIGAPLVVTRADGATIHDLAGRPVLDRLDEVLLGLDDAEQAVVRQGLHLGRVIDEHRTEFGPGDFVIGSVVDVDRVARSIVVADPIEVGATVQFQVRDAIAADQDLRAVLAGHHGAGALVFAGGGRGVRLFDAPDHDAELVSLVVERESSAGMFGAGVFTTGGARSIDDRTAVVALFHDR